MNKLFQSLSTLVRNSCFNRAVIEQTIRLDNQVFLRRGIATSPILHQEDEWVNVTFIKSDGTRIPTKGKVGNSLLDVVVNNDIDLDGFGACEGTLACSTCHLVFKDEDFKKIDSKVTDEELDMLDMAYGLTETSRLGCQVLLKKELDGMEVTAPAGVNDART